MQIIDSHTHWGLSISLGTHVTTEELLHQAQQSGVQRIVIFPFPSMALADHSINQKILDEAKKIGSLIPYFYIPETMHPIPTEKGFYGGKWHWMKGVQDCSSNYGVLDDPQIFRFIEESEAIGLPIVFEEELAFTEVFVKKTKNLKIIIPHMGLLGGNPLDFLQSFQKKENIFFDTALASPETIKIFFEKIGSERILFGSDIPFGTMKRELEKVLSLSMGDEQKEGILSKNIKRLIDLK